jgi:hypothetical protein
MYVIVCYLRKLSRNHTIRVTHMQQNGTERLQLLRYTLPNNAKINARTHEIMFGPRLISLSLVSRDLHDLAIKTYYQDNIVNYSRSIMIRQYSKDSGPEPASFPDPHPSSQQ